MFRKAVIQDVSMEHLLQIDGDRIQRGGERSQVALSVIEFRDQHINTFHLIIDVS